MLFVTLLVVLGAAYGASATTSYRTVRCRRIDGGARVWVEMDTTNSVYHKVKFKLTPTSSSSGQSPRLTNFALLSPEGVLTNFIGTIADLPGCASVAATADYCNGNTATTTTTGNWMFFDFPKRFSSFDITASVDATTYLPNGCTQPTENIQLLPPLIDTAEICIWRKDRNTPGSCFPANAFPQTICYQDNLIFSNIGFADPTRDIGYIKFTYTCDSCTMLSPYCSYYYNQYNCEQNPMPNNRIESLAPFLLYSNIGYSVDSPADGRLMSFGQYTIDWTVTETDGTEHPERTTFHNVGLCTGAAGETVVTGGP